MNTEFCLKISLIIKLKGLLLAFIGLCLKEEMVKLFGGYLVYPKLNI
jgi:hypothetical protein